jgi:hypothetical protein
VRPTNHREEKINMDISRLFAASSGFLRAIASILLALSLLNACTTPVNRPNISLSSDSLQLKAKTGQRISGDLLLENSGNGTLNYSIAIAAADTWLVMKSGATGSVASKASQTISAEASCPSQATELSSNVRITATGISNLSKSFTVWLKCETPDTTPDGFDFTNTINAEISSDITSAPVLITGIEATTPVSASNGGVVLVNGIAASSINTNQQLSIRLRSSNLFETTVTSTVNVGGVVRNFSIATGKEVTLGLSLNPGVLSIAKGDSKGIGVNISRKNLDQSVVVTAQGLPIGVTSNSLSLASGINTGTLSLSVADNAPVGGSFDVVVTASGGGKTSSQTLKLSIDEAVAKVPTISGYQNINTAINKPIVAQTPVISGGTAPYSVTVVPTHAHQVKERVARKRR